LAQELFLLVVELESILLAVMAMALAVDAYSEASTCSTSDRPEDERDRLLSQSSLEPAEIPIAWEPARCGKTMSRPKVKRYGWTCQVGGCPPEHWSRGSKNHSTGQCRPCYRYAESKECSRGLLCNFCHHRHDSQKLLESLAFSAHAETRRDVFRWQGIKEWLTSEEQSLSLGACVESSPPVLDVPIFQEPMYIKPAASSDES